MRRIRPRSLQQIIFEPGRRSKEDIVLLSSRYQELTTKTMEVSSYALYRKCVVCRLGNTKRSWSEGAQFLTELKESCGAATFGSAFEARSRASSSVPVSSAQRSIADRAEAPLPRLAGDVNNDMLPLDARGDHHTLLVLSSTQRIAG